jgi:hypothetical protein
MRCGFLDLEGRCHGPYMGFGCIKEKCSADRQVSCEFNEQGFYCRKYRRFECVGVANCGTFDDYMSFVNERRKHAQVSK